LIWTGIVVPDAEDRATVPTLVTIPALVWRLGSVIITRSPALMLDCCAASRLTVTWRRVEVPCATGAPGPALVPSVAVTLEIRSGPGRNTACPSLSDPVP
jgi:hypothetical protein